MQASLTEQSIHPADAFEALADELGSAVCIRQGEVTLGWDVFERRAASVAGALADGGVRAGDRVAISLHNDPAYLETALAALKQRAAPINLNYRYLTAEMLHILEHAEVAAVVFDATIAGEVEAAARRLTRRPLLIQVGGVPSSEVRAYEDCATGTPHGRIARAPDDLWMFYTGGTTGLPRGVMNTAGPYTRGIMRAALGAGTSVPSTAEELRSYARRIAASQEARVSLCIAPFVHSTGFLVGAYAPMLAGASVVLPETRRFDPPDAMRLVQKWKVTDLAIAGEVFARPIVEVLEDARATGRAYDVSSLQRLQSSGMVLLSETKMRLLEHAPSATITEILGATEGFAASSVATRDHVPATGTFVPGPGTKLLRDDGTVIPFGAGEPGALAVSGETIGSGYYRDPSKTAEVYREIDGVRHAVTGDRAVIEADGLLRVLGRDSMHVNTGGMKVSSYEVENALLDLDGVSDALVVGVPDPVRGENVVALLKAASPPLDVEDLRRDLRSRLASFKVPRTLVIVDEVPRFTTGKPDYETAKAMAEDHDRHDPAERGR